MKEKTTCEMCEACPKVYPPGTITPVPVDKNIREWESGGKRDTEEGKLDFEGFLSPLVIQRYAEYMNKHRTMADGSLRDSDNWQKGFGSLTEHFKVCMKSLFRHFMDMWSAHRGYESREGMEEAICGILFNVMAYLHRILEFKIPTTKEYFTMQEYIKDIKSIPGSKAGELE